MLKYGHESFGVGTPEKGVPSLGPPNWPRSCFDSKKHWLMKKLAVWLFQKKGVMMVDVACSMYSEKAEHARVGQDMMHVVSSLHFSMEQVVAAVAQTQRAVLWLFEHEDWTTQLNCLDTPHLKNWKLKENFDVGRLRHGTWRSKDQSRDQLAVLSSEWHHMFEDETLWSVQDMRRFSLVAFA